LGWKRLRQYKVGSGPKNSQEEGKILENRKSLPEGRAKIRNWVSSNSAPGSFVGLCGGGGGWGVGFLVLGGFGWVVGGVLGLGFVGCFGVVGFVGLVLGLVGGGGVFCVF